VSFLRIIHDYSLAVVLGAPACLYLFTSEANCSLSFSLYLLLSCAIALIYWLDHHKDNLNSSLKAKEKPFLSLLRPPYFYFLMGAVLCFSLFLLFSSEWLLADWLTGLVALAMWLLYFLVQTRFSHSVLSKISEVWIALVVSIALGLPVLLRDFSPSLLLFVFLFFLLCLQNLFLFAIVDYTRDQQNGKLSFATRNGKEYVYQWIDLLSLIGIALALDAGTESAFSPFIILYLGMQAVFIVVRYLSTKPYSAVQIRVWADGIFILPYIAFYLGA